MRNKLVSIERKGEDILLAHGILDDDIYSLKIDVAIRMSHYEILSIEGKWSRQENSECPRAIPFLQEAVGFRMDEGFSQKVNKIIGRKACRHYADLLLECCDAAKEAAALIGWVHEKGKRPGLTFEEFFHENQWGTPGPALTPSVSSKNASVKEKSATQDVFREKKSGGMIIDLHVHSSVASPCSSAPVDVLIEEAKKIGLDGMCLTDHNHVWD